MPGFTRRSVLGQSALALTAVATPALGATAGVPLPGAGREPSPRSHERLADWRFHLGHAADVERDFGFGRNQRTFAKAEQALATSN